MAEIQKQVEDYVEWQCRGRAKVISSKPEQSYNELGFNITIWNVKTDHEGSWWVAQGDLPMNLYPQDRPYYFSTDEVFSFHLGTMLRLMDDEASQAEQVIDQIVQNTELFVNIRRKLDLAADKLSQAFETEEIQAIGVMCREALIELIGDIDPNIFEGIQGLPKKSDVKSRGEIAINKLLFGPDNAELRKHMKNLLNGAWDYSNTITHSTSRTVYEASICLTMTAAIASSFKNLLDKHHDPISGLKCKVCGSRRLLVAENNETPDLLIICENCRHGFIKD